MLSSCVGNLGIVHTLFKSESAHQGQLEALPLPALLASHHSRPWEPFSLASFLIPHVCRLTIHSFIHSFIHLIHHSLIHSFHPFFVGDQTTSFVLEPYRSLTPFFATHTLLFRMAAFASEYLTYMIAPEKFAAAVFGVTLTLTVLSANTVGFRTWFRLRDKQFGSDDTLMCIALVVNMVHNSLVMHGTFVGIGSPDSKLNPELFTEGKKVRCHTPAPVPL